MDKNGLKIDPIFYGLSKEMSHNYFYWKKVPEFSFWLPSKHHPGIVN